LLLLLSPSLPICRPSQVVRTEFMPNPHAVLLLPEKPCDRRRELALRQDAAAEAERSKQLDALAQTDPRAHAQVVGRLERSTRSPRAKYPMPQTAAMEIGWDLDFNAVHADESRPYSYPHTNGDISTYADRYVYSHGYNPFSTQQFKYLAKPGHKK